MADVMTVVKSMGSGADCFLPQLCHLKNGDKNRTKLPGESED